MVKKDVLQMLATFVSSDGLARWTGYAAVFRQGLVALLKEMERKVSIFSPHMAMDLFQMVAAVTTLPTSSDGDGRRSIEDVLIAWAPVLCHPYIASPSDKYSWITVVQSLRIDPGRLADANADVFKRLVMDSELGLFSESKMFRMAGKSLVTLLSLVSPNVLVPELIRQLLSDLDPLEVTGIGETEVGIWKWNPQESLPFVQVLKRTKVIADRNRKDYETELWEQEVREELAAKGKAKYEKPKLSKEEQATIESQLAKEAKVRQRLRRVSEQYHRGLDVLEALVEGNAKAVADTGHIGVMVQTLLDGACKVGELVEGRVVNIFLNVGRCAERLEEIREPLAMAILRARGVPEIPVRWTIETVENLVTRMLYRVRHLSEFQPTPPSSFGYMFPLLEQVIQTGGIGYAKGTAEKTTEQVVVATDIIGFHCDSVASKAMPRKQMAQCLFRVIKEHPQSSKTAKSALQRLCEAMEGVDSDEVSVFFDALLLSQPVVRNASLNALESLNFPDITYSRELYISIFDEDERNAELARGLWRMHDMKVSDDYVQGLLDLVIHEFYNVRLCAAKALAGGLEEHPQTVHVTLRKIYELYQQKAALPMPRYDEYGMVIPASLELTDATEARAGLAKALKECARFVSGEELDAFFGFLIAQEALGDRSEDVRQRMLDGDENAQTIMPILEEYLSRPALPNEVHDRIRESVVILFGAAASHLPSDDPKIQSAVDKLIAVLSTPSEAVQAAVADCLPGLIKSIKASAPALIDHLLTEVFTSNKYAVRRGAAYGLSGTVKGRGISALKDCGIMTRLKEAVDDKKHYETRQGAIFCFETLSQSLGRLFEPYVIQILPLLLLCFGDPIKDVREATSDAARVIMSKISGHCVKLVLPSLLSGLDDSKWRTKAGSVELLGSMAFCAPKQLSISLPTIVPRIAEVLNDSHQAVQKAARAALSHFVNVITNPEIQKLVPTLMNALCDPNNQTGPALSALLDTAFIHYIDAPSLALIIPILERGLKERSFDVRKRSTQIIGNMASLTDQRDLTPYLPKLLPGVKEVLVDPVPEARATAAKALGTMVEKLGESYFPTLVQELIQTLKSDTSSVDRSGAAQGLSEVMAGLGVERMEGLLPEIVLNTSSSKPFVREGFLSLLIYLPATFGLRFQPYLGRIIPPILNGLADKSEFVREASLRAGRMIVRNYATRAVDLLLPELEKGLFDENWRIRQSSVELLADLLYRITGVSAKPPGDEEDGDSTSTEAGRKASLDVLGEHRRNSVLAALFIVRSDGLAMVRQASIQVWKSIVNHTPRTLKEILPVLMKRVIEFLASPDYSRRQVAARTLGEIIRRLGESIITEVLPILEHGLESSDPHTRQGACVGLSEIMTTLSKTHAIEWMDTFIPAVQKGLCDKNSEVREAAAQAFDHLHQHIGNKAIDDILPALLSSLQNGDESSHALDALKEVMAVRSNVVFPVLIPALIVVPINAFNARALAALVEVAGTALTKRLSTILQALTESLNGQDEETVKAIRETIRIVLLSVDDEDGVAVLMSMLFESARSELPATRAGTCGILQTFLVETRADVSRYVGGWMRQLLKLLVDKDEAVVDSSWKALSALTDKLRKEELEGYVVPVRKILAKVAQGLAPGEEIRGFCRPKGIAPLLPLFLHGLLYGSSQSREQSADGIGELVQRTDVDSLKPFVTQITGPLIRVIGDRHPADVKGAILRTLGILLSKVPAFLKPFLPQLQRTFVRSLTDPDPALQVQAEEVLHTLTTIHVLPDFVAGVKTRLASGSIA